MKHIYPVREHTFTGNCCEAAYTVRSVTEADLEAVLRLQETVRLDLPDLAFLCTATRAELADSIQNDLCLGVFDGGRIVAFTILIVNRSCPGNLGQKLGFPPEECVTFEIVFVHPDCRGLGMQRFFIEERERYARRLGAKRGFSTVAPKNYFSLNNILGAGFSIYDRREMYGGMDRYIMMKQF